MGCGNDWSQAFSEEQYAQFWDETMTRWNGNGVVNYQELTWAYLLGTDAADYGSAAQPLSADVIDRASQKATAAGPTDSTAANTGWTGVATTRPTEPKIDEAGIIPVGTSILVGGIGIVVMAQLLRLKGTIVDVASGAISPAAAADDAIAGIQAAFDCAVLWLRDARDPKTQVKGHTSTSWSSGRIAVMGPPMETTDGVVDSVLYAGQVPAKDRGWARIPPVKFDGGGPDRPGQSQSQLAIQHIIPRSTAWPLESGTRMRIEVVLPSLVGYRGSAGSSGGGDCDVPPLPSSPPPNYNQRIPGKTRW